MRRGPRYSVLLKSCEHDADVDSAFQLLEEMLDNGVTPRPTHHNVALQTCVAAGRLDLAFRHFIAVTTRGKPGVTYDGNTCVNGSALRAARHLRRRA